MEFKSWVILSRMTVQCKSHGQSTETKAIGQIAKKVVGRNQDKSTKSQKPKEKFQRTYETTSDATKSFDETRFEEYPLY